MKVALIIIVFVAVTLGPLAVLMIRARYGGRGSGSKPNSPSGGAAPDDD